MAMMTTTERSRRAVRITAIAGVALAGAATTMAIGADPYPQGSPARDAQRTALEATERALVRAARQANAAHAARWARYRAQLEARRREIAAIEDANARAVAVTTSPVGSVPAAVPDAQPQAVYVPDPPVASSGSS